MASDNETIKVTVEKNGERISARSSTGGEFRIVIIINNQITTAPNTTQIASGAGKNSTAGNNAAIDSSNTLQQQSVGAQGTAENSGQSGTQTEPHAAHEPGHQENEIVLVLNNQRNRTGSSSSESDAQPDPQPQTSSSATQVASGGGLDSAAGTNAALGSSNTKQQHAVGGAEGGTAENAGQDADQTEQ